MFVRNVIGHWCGSDSGIGEGDQGIMELTTMQKVFALYKGDTLLSVGTIEEIHRETGKTIKTLRWMTKPSYKKRCKPNSNRLEMVLIDD